MRFKLGGAVALFVSISVFAYSYSYSDSDNEVQSVSKSEVANTEEVKSEDTSCHLSSPADKAENHDHQAMAMMLSGQDQSPQNPSPGQGGQPGDTATHRLSPGNGCSSVNPKARNKDRDGVNPNTVGCKCVKKCVDGQTQEDLSKDDKGVYICKNACHKDRCTCPDPCKS